MKFSFGLLIRAAAALVGLFVLWIGVGIVSSRPQTFGTVSVSGVSAPAQIVRDKHGVPHIFAENDHDAYFALGYAHAQDRFFQMDLTRRSVFGTLSELAGDLTMRLDARARVKGLNRIAEAQTDALSPPVREVLQAYTDGVNARLAQGAPSVEYALLLAQPAPWRVEDSVAVGLALTDTLVSGEQFDFAAATLGRKLTPRQFSEFFPRFPDWAVDSLGSYGPATSTRGRISEGISPGSNAWAVTGTKTKSGLPILAGDPHLGLTAPGPFYLTHLRLAERNLVGFTVPGAPFLAFGRNDDVAWAITNNEVDAVDIAPIDAEAARAAFVRTEIVRVRQFIGSPREMEVSVRETSDGPLLDRTWFKLEPYGESDFIWRDITLDADNDLINSLAAINAARTIDEIIAAQRGWRAPLVHIVAASRDGVALIAAGDPPTRDPTGAWTGRSSADDRLILRDPPNGYLAAANNIARASDFATSPNGAFDPFRVRRIHQLLEQGSSADLTGGVNMQMDLQSLFAQRMAPVLRDARPTTAHGKAALALIAQWDGRMGGDRAEPLIFAAWIDALSASIYKDELGDEHYAQFGGSRLLFLDSILTHGADAWCDDIKSPEREACRDLLGPALDTTVASLDRKYGADISKWRWRDAHVARFAHPLFSGLPVAGDWFDVTAPIGGAEDTLAVGAYLGDGNFTAVHGPGARAVYDLADLNLSRFMVAPGQSGNPLSPHYRDLIGLWANGESFEVRADWSVDTPPRGAQVLTLKPR